MTLTHTTTAATSPVVEAPARSQPPTTHPGATPPPKRSHTTGQMPPGTVLELDSCTSEMIQASVTGPLGRQGCYTLTPVDHFLTCFPFTVSERAAPYLAECCC